MPRSWTAVLLSALVFPGAGHLWLKRRARACLFLLPTIVAVFVLLQQVTERASVIANDIVEGRMGLDPAAIAARVEAVASPGMDAAVWIIVLCWVLAIADSLYLSRKTGPA